MYSLGLSSRLKVCIAVF